MKRKHYIFIIALYSAPMIIVVSWIFFHTLFPEKKCVVAQLKSVGYCMKIAEVGDNTLHIEMYKSRKGHDIDIIARDAFWKVISLVFVEKNDTVFIRANLSIQDLQSTGNEKRSAVPIKEIKVNSPVIGKLPKKCVVIPFYDNRFIKYNKDNHSYAPAKDGIHIFNLVHDTERTNTFYLYEITKTDTTEIKLEDYRHL